MKATLRKLIGTAVLGLALFSPGAPAWAGEVDLYGEVIVGTSGAAGALPRARYSADGTQYIGCSFSHSLGLTVDCSARDKTGKSLGCWSNDTRFVDAAKAITDSSFINFTVTPGTASCSELTVTNSSAFLR